MQILTLTIGSVVISIATLICAAIAFRIHYVDKPLSKKTKKILMITENISIGIIITSMIVALIVAGFTTQGTYNKAIIITAIDGKPKNVAIDTNTKIGLNITADGEISLTPVTDTIEIQQANGNTNFKANVLVKYKMVKNEKSILNFYKEYGTTNIKTIVNNEIKSEIAKQEDFAKTCQISEQTFKNIQKGLNNTFEFQSITVSDFVSSNSQNINLNTNK